MESWTRNFLRPARQGREPSGMRIGRDLRPALAPPELEKKASAAAEVMPVHEPLLDRRFPFDTSRTVEDLDPPQHDDDGRYQRGRRQDTFQ
jgi:hypothetical protein